MSLKFGTITRIGIRALTAGARLTEHGITVERLRTGDLRYSVNVMVDGRRIHRVVGRESEGVTREQAERVVETLRTHAREQRLNLPKGRKVASSFEEAAQDYLKKLGEEGGKALARKETHLRTRLIPFFGTMRLDRMTEGDTQRYAKARQAGGVKAGTINRELATFSHLLRSAARWGWITKDQVPDVVHLREGVGRIIALSIKQSEALLISAKADQDPDLYLFILICLQTSMRHGEARKLMWKNYDANRRRFYIPEAKSGEREQPIPESLAEVLNEQRSSRKGESEYLFRAGPGSQSNFRHTFRKAFQRAVIRAGLDPNTITPHVLRHTAITRLVKAGVDLPTIQRVSGHKTLAMVLRYSHVDGQHVDRAIEHLSV